MEFLQILCLLCVAHSGTASNVLISGFLGKGSHFLNLIPVGKSLVKRGHNVTLLIHQDYSSRADDPELANLFNFEFIPNNDPSFSTIDYFDFITNITFRDDATVWSFFKTVPESMKVMTQTCDEVLGDTAMMKRFEGLDAIVADFGWPCVALIKVHLKKHSNRSIRLIFSTPTMPSIPAFMNSGTPYNPAYQPSIMSGLTSSMTFRERVLNTITAMPFQFFQYFGISLFKETLRKFDLLDQVEVLGTCFQRVTDLVLVNYDFPVEYPFARSPSLIPIGGVTASPPSPLPADLEDFMQSSGKHGAVVFSLGSYFASLLTEQPDLLNAFLGAFSRLPQKVIIQLKVPLSYDLPSNVKALPWLPQNDLLGHPKTLLFVYHGGNNGFYEAIYHGVPLVIIPFMGDQIDSAARATSHGFGTSLDKKHITADAVYEQVSQVLNNPKYGETAKRFSAIMRDRPLAPADRAAFWIEHVIKHGGEYMRSPALDLSFIQYNLLDVFAFFLALIGLVIFVMYKSIKLCCSRCSCECCCHRRKGAKNKTE